MGDTRKCTNTRKSREIDKEQKALRNDAKMKKVIEKPTINK